MILVNAQFSKEESYGQLVHAPWHGWTFADTIFPAFLVIVGVSLALSIAARLDRGEAAVDLLRHAVVRAFLIFACGVAVDYLRFPVPEFPFAGLQHHVQLTGVLEKIAVCYLITATIYILSGLRGVIAAILGLNALHLGLLYAYPVPGCVPGTLTETCSFSGYIDDVLLHGFRWNSADFDPDGAGTVLPAATNVLFGVLGGIFLRNEPRLSARLIGLVAAGAVLVAIGEGLSGWVPINKHLWTTSFVALTAGLASGGLGIFIWLVDVIPTGLLRPLEVLGKNALAAYLISRVVAHVPRVHVMGKSVYTDVLSQVASPAAASLIFALLVLVMVYIPVWFLDRRQWHLKL